MQQRPEKDCEDTCMEHSGIKTMITVVLVGVVIQLGMQTYNNFFAVAEIKTSIVEIKTDLNNLKNEMRTADTAIDKRVASLEDFVYKRK